MNESSSWLAEVRTWIAARLEDPAFAWAREQGYGDHLYTSVTRLRTMALTDKEMARSCRGTAYCLFYGNQLWRTGKERNITPTVIAVAMFRSFPDYRWFITMENVLSNQGTIDQVAALQTLDGQLFMLIANYIEPDADWFPRIMEELKVAANKVWVDEQFNKTIEASENTNPKEESRTVQSSSAPPPPKELITSASPALQVNSKVNLSWGIIALVATIWLWNAKVGIPTNAEAFGFLLWSVGLPGTLLSIALSRISTQLKQRGVAAPRKFALAYVFAIFAVLGGLDFLASRASHRLGGLFLFLAFGISATILSFMGYKKERSAKLC